MNNFIKHALTLLAFVLAAFNIGCSTSDCKPCCSLEESSDGDAAQEETELPSELEPEAEPEPEAQVETDAEMDAEPDVEPEAEIEEEPENAETEEAAEAESLEDDVDEQEIAEDEQTEDESEEETEAEPEAETEEETEPPACSLVHTGLPLNAACVSNDQCESGMCLDVFCSADCSQDAGVCGENQVCFKDYGLCIPNKMNENGYPDFGTHDSSLGLYAPCFNDDDCYGGRCFVNFEADSETPVFFCTAPCKDDEAACDCGYCNAHEDICVPGGKKLGEPCSDSMECISMDCENFYKDFVYCTRECLSDADCEGGRCVQPYEGADYKMCARAEDADSAFGDECAVDWECASGVCYAYKCNEACAANEDCPEEYACAFMSDAAARRCAPASSVGIYENGEQCVFDYNCKSGYCKTAPRVQTTLWLYDENFQQLTSDSAINYEYFSRVTYTPPAYGVLYLYVSHYPGSTGPYLLIITDDSFSALTLADETEPNDSGSPQAAGVNYAIKAAINDENDSDWFQFDAPAGRTLTITTTLMPYICEEKPACPANDELALPLAAATYNFVENSRDWTNCNFIRNDGFERSFDFWLARGEKIRVKAAPRVLGAADISLVVTLPCQNGCLAVADQDYMGDSALGASTFESLVFTAPDDNKYTLTVESGAGTSAETQFDLTIELNPTASECKDYMNPLGCCLNDGIVRYCDEAGFIHDISCGAPAVCEWSGSSSDIYYTCGVSGLPEDPNGGYSRSCDFVPWK